MGVTLPSLEGQLYLRDTQSIIGYTLRRYSRTPKDTVTILPDMIISLPWRIAQFGRDPDSLVFNIQSDLQGVFGRIFANERPIQVSVIHTPGEGNSYNIEVSIIYTLKSGELEQTGTKLSLDKTTGRLSIPEDRISWDINPY